MFHCDQCGLCCKRVGITDQYKHLDRGDGVCLHFDTGTNLCSIYKDRPVICRVDASFELFFQDQMTIEEFYEINYKSCEMLKGLESHTMSDLKSALVAKFEEIFGYTPGDEYAPRVKNAREIICQGRYSKDEMIDITDTSIFSNGKSGLVLTVDSVCVKDSGNFTSKFIAKYEDIESTYIKEERFLGADLSALELNMRYGAKYQISIKAISRNKLMKFIDYAASLYQEDDTLEW